MNLDDFVALYEHIYFAKLEVDDLIDVIVNSRQCFDQVPGRCFDSMYHPLHHHVNWSVPSSLFVVTMPISQLPRNNPSATTLHRSHRLRIPKHLQIECHIRQRRISLPRTYSENQTVPIKMDCLAMVYRWRRYLKIIQMLWGTRPRLSRNKVHEALRLPGEL